jgi:hypothetical protein
MLTALRNIALATITGLVLVSPARADWLVDYSNAVDFAVTVHVQFDIPTFLTSDTATTFSLNIGGATKFVYALPGSGEGLPAFSYVRHHTALRRYCLERRDRAAS